MTIPSTTRTATGATALLAVVLLTALGALVLPGGAPAAHAAPAGSAATVPATAPARSAGPTTVAPRTTVTFAVRGCEGCRVQLHSATRHRQDVWSSRRARVRDGVVTFRAPTARTEDLSASLAAPWEGATGSVAQVVFAYPGQAVGSHVSRREAVSHHRAAGCWAGTAERAVTLRLRVGRVRVAGVDGSPTTAAVAWTTRSQPARGPRARAERGRLGAQDVLFCRPGA